jgi:hypothetical protein
MVKQCIIIPGQILTGSLFNEPMRVDAMKEPMQVRENVDTYGERQS